MGTFDVRPITIERYWFGRKYISFKADILTLRVSQIEKQWEVVIELKNLFF